jgi:serine-type D-Ala-D-Ala carboxypeptidase/endopeptidase
MTSRSSSLRFSFTSPRERSSARVLLPALAAFGALTLGACGSSSDDPQSPDAAPMTDASDQALRWAEVDRITREAVAAAAVPGLGLAVYDASDRKVFEKMYGDFAPDREVAIASSSKLVSGLVLLDLVSDGALSLDSTAAAVLGWTGVKGTITLRHLLSFTSGLESEHACTLNVASTLAACVEQIAETTLVALPGAQFDYGSVHLAVAGRMAEVVSGKPWAQLFSERLATPLGLPASVKYYTAPRQSLGNSNPLIAGGLRASMDQYAKLLAVAFHKGVYAGASIATPALFETQSSEPYPSATIEDSPFAKLGYAFHYGLASWLECPPPAANCAVLSSPGAFGFTPWYDRATGYYAIIGTEVSDSGGANGVVSFAVALAQQLKPAIATALGGR